MICGASFSVAEGISIPPREANVRWQKQSALAKTKRVDVTGHQLYHSLHGLCGRDDAILSIEMIDGWIVWMQSELHPAFFCYGNYFLKESLQIFPKLICILALVAFRQSESRIRGQLRCIKILQIKGRL